MKNRKKIIFIVDVKDRDLEGLKRIGMYLKDLNYKCIYLPGNIESKNVLGINPDAIVIPKANFNKHRHASHTIPIRIYKPTYITSLWPGQVTCDLSRRVESPGRGILYKCVLKLVLYGKKTLLIEQKRKETR